MKRYGGVIHTYLGYDPVSFPPPSAPPPDILSGAFEHLLAFGTMDGLSPEDLANAVQIDPEQIAGLGPSLDALIALLEARRRRILETYETDTVAGRAADAFHRAAAEVRPPDRLARRFQREVRAEHLRGLEHLWYAAEEDHPRFAGAIPGLVEHLGAKYQVDELAAKYAFTGRKSLAVEEALEVKRVLEAIDRLLAQLREAKKDARVGIVDMEALREFAEQADVERLEAMGEQVRRLIEAAAEAQGLERDGDGWRMTPKATRLFQGRLLEIVFADLKASRTGRHTGPIAGDGAVEIPSTRPYAFGDSVTHMDVPQSILNAFARAGGDAVDPSGRVRVAAEDLEIHRTRNTPKCATSVIMDMSGSMRWSGLYVHCKRMALAFDGLIRREYPGDHVSFIEMYSIARLRAVADLPGLMPKPVTIRHPVVRLAADMSDPEITEHDLPPHFTNIQHALRLARQMLGGQDTPNRQIVLITDGLPTAHFEAEKLYLLYPPDSRTEQATMREARGCAKEGITINVFLLPTWSQSEEDIRFAHRMVEATNGRVFFTAGGDLDRFVLWDYVAHRRAVIG